MRIEDLVNRYGFNEPIFIDEIKAPNIAYNNLKQIFKRYVDQGKMRRFSNGIYYFPKKSPLLGMEYLDVDKVIEKKYLGKDDSVFGFYSGYALANMANLTTQVPFETELTTNKEKTRGRCVTVSYARLKLKKSRVKINTKNVNILQVFDVISNADSYSEYDQDTTNKLLRKYIKRKGVSKKDLKKYIEFYPAKLAQIIIAKELYNAFA